MLKNANFFSMVVAIFAGSFFIPDWTIFLYVNALKHV